MLQKLSDQLHEHHRRAEERRWFAAALIQIQNNLDRMAQDIAQAQADGLIVQKNAEGAHTRCDKLSERDVELFAQSRDLLALSKNLLGRTK
jgi:hypothetical protein